MRGRGERRQGGQQDQSVDVSHLTSRNNIMDVQCRALLLEDTWFCLLLIH